MFLDQFYNANNRTWQYYLNLTKMYNYSLFANAVVFCTSAPSVDITSMKYVESAGLEVTAGNTIELHIETTPFPANGEISYTSGNTSKATVAAKTGDPKTVVVTAKEAVSSVNITASANSGATTAVYALKINAAE